MPKKRKAAPTKEPDEKTFIHSNNAVLIGDIHAGCKLSVYPTDPDILLDLGVGHKPSKLQRTITGYFYEFFDHYVPAFCEGEPYVLILAGDSLDGRHHKSVTQVSQNIADQLKIAEALLRPIIERPECKALYMIRGTEAHVGPSAENEETLAKTLGAIPDKEGHFSRFVLKKIIGNPKGANCLIHAMHHIGTTGSQAFESTAVMKEITESFIEAARWGTRPPDYIVRAHRHRFIHVRIATRNERAEGIVLPGWQGLTPFTYKLPGSRMAVPQFGGVVIRQGKEEHYSRQKVWPIYGPEEE